MVKVDAFISRPSFSVYRFILNFIHELLWVEQMPMLDLSICPGYLQSLAIGGQARDAHEAHLVDLEHALEVAVHSHELSRQTRVRCNRHAVLALHGKH